MIKTKIVKSFVCLVVLTFSYFSLAANAAGVITAYPLGEKSFQSTPLTVVSYSIDSAKMESHFFIVAIDNPFNLKKHLPIYDVSADSIAPFDVKVSWLLGHNIKNSTFADDIVIPMNQENLNALPKENFPKRHLLLIEIKSLLNSSNGLWKGNLLLSNVSDKAIYKIPLQFNLHKFALPAEFSLRTSFGFAPWNVLKKHQVANDIEDKIYNSYFTLARKHRIDLHKMYIEYSRNTENILGSANLPSHSFNNIWQMAKGIDQNYIQMRTTDLPVPEEFKNDDAKNEHFWKTLNKEAKGNENFFVYFEDEPTSQKIKTLIPVLKAIHQWAPDIKIMMTTNWSKELEGLVQIFCPNLIFWNQPQYPSPTKYTDFAKNPHQEFWVYVSCNSHGCDKNEVIGLPDLIIDRSASFTFSLPWVADAIKASGILYYDTVRGYLENDKSPWLDPMLFNGMGEGNLFYPCPLNVCSKLSPAVFPSLRLKILQNSLESLEIYRNAIKSKPALVQLREKVVRNPRVWSKKISDYQQLKKASLEILDAN